MLLWRQLGSRIFIFLGDFIKKKPEFEELFMTEANRSRTQKVLYNFFSLQNQ